MRVEEMIVWGIAQERRVAETREEESGHEMTGDERR